MATVKEIARNRKAEMDVEIETTLDAINNLKSVLKEHNDIFCSDTFKMEKTGEQIDGLGAKVFDNEDIRNKINKLATELKSKI